MVADRTCAKRKCRKRQPEMEALARHAKKKKNDLLLAVDEDTAAFEQVLVAMRLPQGNPEQEETRLKAIEAGYRHATEVPMNTARLCLEVLELAHAAVGRGMPASITDAGTACWMARAGVESALYNVRVNLGELQDSDWKSAIIEETVKISAQADQILRESRSQVDKIL